MGHAASFLAVAAMAVCGAAAAPVAGARPITPQNPSPAGVDSPLDFDVFRTTVQPILTGARKGHARCTSCHTRGGNAYLEPLAPGSTTYTDEQSKRNFERVSRLVVPGDPLKSILLTNPLEHEAGGSHWHAGGKHWQSQADPEWQTLATWVKTRGAIPRKSRPTAGSSANTSACPSLSLVCRSR